MHLFEFPHEILIAICVFLHEEDKYSVLRFAGTCKTIRGLIENEKQFWNEFFDDDETFPHTLPWVWYKMRRLNAFLRRAQISTISWVHPSRCGTLRLYLRFHHKIFYCYDTTIHNLLSLALWWIDDENLDAVGVLIEERREMIFPHYFFGYCISTGVAFVCGLLETLAQHKRLDWLLMLATAKKSDDWNKRIVSKLQARMDSSANAAIVLQMWNVTP